MFSSFDFNVIHLPLLYVTYNMFNNSWYQSGPWFVIRNCGYLCCMSEMRCTSNADGCSKSCLFERSLILPRFKIPKLRQKPLKSISDGSEAMMKFILIFIQLLFAQENNEKQPNIIYVLADDLGWGDVNWNNKGNFIKK